MGLESKVFTVGCNGHGYPYYDGKGDMLLRLRHESTSTSETRPLHIFNNEC